MKNILRILPLMVLCLWWVYADKEINVSLDFCGTSANALTYHIDAGVETGICYVFSNHSNSPVTIKIWFVDGTFTNDQQQNKACLSDTAGEKFWKYVTNYDQLLTIKAGETIKKEAKLLYATGMNGLYHGCIVYSVVEENRIISGFSIIMRKARFIDVVVGKPKIIQGPWIALAEFTSVDGENISNDHKIRIYKDSTDNTYVVQIKVKNISSGDQEVVITWDISNILSYKDTFVETRKILEGDLLVITKKIGEISPYNLKIKFTINNTPFDFDTKDTIPQPIVGTIKEETVIWMWNMIGYIILMGILLFVGVGGLLLQDKKRRKRKHTHHMHAHPTPNHHESHHHIWHKHTHKW